MKKRRTIKEYFSDKTDKEIFAILLFFSCIILMVVLAVFRFCGIGYFANQYEEQEFVPWVQETILFAMKWVEGFFILMILTRSKWYVSLSIAFLYAISLIFISNTTIVYILDIIFATLTPFILSKFQYKRIAYGVILILLMTMYQLLMLFARYEIDINAKFNYIAIIASVFDYKIFIISIYLLIYTWRLRMERINTPNPESEKNYGGGGCFFFFGKFEKVCEVIGKVVVGVCTLGIAPLSVHLYRKAKAKKVQPAEPETQDEKTE